MSAQIYDLIGLGFGPANIAVAGALIDEWDTNGILSCPVQSVCFIEKHLNFRWHPGMLLPGTRMQINWLKDLATLRNPRSPITFLSYLHAQNRLLPFINKGADNPTRKEYADYLSWAAQYVQSRGVSVIYGEEIISLSRGENGTIKLDSKNIMTHQITERRAKILVISPGGTPHLPPTFSLIAPHPKIIHSSAYAASIPTILSSIHLNPTIRIAVIGGGQSSAEVTLDLYNRMNAIPIVGEGHHQVEMIITKGSIKPSDNSPFSNEIFDPSATDRIFSLSTQRARNTIIKEFDSNYGVVNPVTLNILYEILYNQKLDDAISKRPGSDTEDIDRSSRIAILPYSSLVGAEILPNSDSNSDSILLTIQDVLSCRISYKTYDAVICATGYDRTSWSRLLIQSDLGKYFIHNSEAACGPIQLVPSQYDQIIEIEGQGHTAGSLAGATSPGSCISSSPMSSGSLSPLSTHTKANPRMMYVSRAYSLLPVTGEGEHLPRIYLQGCTEMTHGISDSLLSVVGVRAGEIVADVLQRIRDESKR